MLDFFIHSPIKINFAKKFTVDMILKNISILNYKNIAEANLSFSPKINCFVGHNGEGKTNLLDAIYYLSFCRSSTNPNDSQIIRHEADFMMLQGNYETEKNLAEKIYCGLKRHHKKVFKHNDKEYSKLSEHIGRVRLVMVSPNDTELIEGVSEQRRQFMDLVISQYDPEYLYQVIRYKKALQQRNILLRGENEPEDEFISVYEREMATAGAFVYERRQIFLKEFTPIFKRIYEKLAGEGEDVDLVYRSVCSDGPLEEQIRSSRVRDRVMGFSLCGIHRDDLEFSLHGFPIKREGSQGQNKSFVISLKLSQFEFLKNKGERCVPILLLDDIFDKLDTRRVEQIVKMVSEDDFGQIFITDTSSDFLNSMLQQTGKDYRFFTVEGGVFKS